MAIGRPYLIGFSFKFPNMEIAQPKNASLVTPSIIALSIVTIASALGLHFYSKAQADSTGFSWLWLLSVIQITPFAIGIALKSQNYLNFIFLSHFAGFSLAKWNEAQHLTRTFALSKSWIFATQQLTICTLVMGAAYYLARVVVIPNRIRQLPFNDLTLSSQQLRFISAYVILIPVLNEYLPYSLKIVHFALSSAQVLLIICAQSPKDKKLLLLSRIAVPIVAMISFLLYGFLTMFGNYVSFLMVYSFTSNKRSYLIPILAFTVFISAVQSVKNDYRLYLSGSNYATSLSERVQFLSFLLDLQYFHGDEKEEVETAVKDEDIDVALMRGFSRVGDDSLERVLSMTPSVVPFWGGETYDSIPYMFIPRTFWADKPGRHFWNKFGRAYKVLSDDDVQTSVGVGFFAEAYMNFGFGFMYLIAGFMGFFLVLVERLSISILKDKFYFPYLAMMGPFIGLGVDLGSIVNSTVILTACFLLIRPFLMRLAQRDDYTF